MKVLIITDRLFIKIYFSLILKLLNYKFKVADGFGVHDLLSVNKFNYVFVLSHAIDLDVDFFYGFKHADIYFYDCHNLNDFYESYEFSKFEYCKVNLLTLCFRFISILRKMKNLK